MDSIHTDKETLDEQREDPGAEQRKADHIELAFAARVEEMDRRFRYEPMRAAHPGDFPAPMPFLGKTMRAPIWISSMTGGTGGAESINRRLARACGEFGLGMGLGSCRQLLTSEAHWADFDVRAEMGDEALLFANLGIAQIEKSLAEGSVEDIAAMVDRLRADGLIVHVNPLQEWLQPEGDRLRKPPIDTLQALLEMFEFPLIVKEVGQGMGPESLRALFGLPLAAIDFAAHGGTNFSQLEMLRGTEADRDAYHGLSRVGHDATSMVTESNRILEELGDNARCRQVIVSGGIRDFLDGWYLTRKIETPAVYGQGSAFLRPAQRSYEALQRYLRDQIRGLALAEAYLDVV